MKKLLPLYFIINLFTAFLYKRGGVSSQYISILYSLPCSNSLGCTLVELHAIKFIKFIKFIKSIIYLYMLLLLFYILTNKL
jgi:hypothetical protein